MGSKIKEEAKRNLIRIEAPDIFLIQETKMEDSDFLQTSKKLWSKSKAKVVSARGAFGGLGTLWNDSKFSLVSETSNTHWLLLKMQHLVTKESFCLLNVYVPVNAGEKKACWDSIRSQADLGNLDNIIIAEDLLQDWDLLDIKPSSGKYTWSNKRVGPGHIATRLDRFFVQSSFLLLGLDASMQILSCSIFDHNPIKLELRDHPDLGPIPFRLRRTKSALKCWAKTLPNPAAERKNLQNQLDAHHLLSEEAYVTREILKKEVQLQQHFHKACLAEEECWRLKSRCLWLKAGDRNSSFFHKQAQAKKCFNSIAEIKGDTTNHKDFASIKRAAFLHFKNLYSEDVNLVQNCCLLDWVPPSISAEMNRQLEAKVTKAEVKNALSAMDPDKAPGPDGFFAKFLQSCWHIVEKDLYKMVQKSQACQKIEGSTNSTFFALIPKEKGASSFNRFRPISLCNIGYKLITKVIANRLKYLLPKIIPEN
eukprot:PITA_03795